MRLQFQICWSIDKIGFNIMWAADDGRAATRPFTGNSALQRAERERRLADERECRSRAKR